MKTLTLIITVLTAWPSFAMNCVATRMYANLTRKSEPLVITYDTPAHKKMSADIGEIHYLVTIDTDTDTGASEVLTWITVGPDYQRGSVSSSVLVEGSQIRHSRVDGRRVNQVICN